MIAEYVLFRSATMRLASGVTVLFLLAGCARPKAGKSIVVNAWEPANVRTISETGRWQVKLVPYLGEDTTDPVYYYLVMQTPRPSGTMRLLFDGGPHVVWLESGAVMRTTDWLLQALADSERLYLLSVRETETHGLPSDEMRRQVYLHVYWLAHGQIIFRTNWALGGGEEKPSPQRALRPAKMSLLETKPGIRCGDAELIFDGTTLRGGLRGGGPLPDTRDERGFTPVPTPRTEM